MSLWDFLDSQAGIMMALVGLIGIIAGIVGGRLRYRRCDHATCKSVHMAHQIFPENSRADMAYRVAIANALNDAIAVLREENEGKG